MFWKCSTLKYLGTTVTNENLIHEEIKSRFNSGKACYHSVQILLPYRLLSKNVKMKVYSTIISRVVLYGCEPWYLTLKGKHRMRLFKDKVLRGIFWPKGVEVIGGWKIVHNKKLHDLYSSPNIIRMITSRRMQWAGHVARILTEINIYSVLLENQQKK
jgi:hypothetical protein